MTSHRNQQDMTIERFEQLIAQFQAEWNEWSRMRSEADDRLATLSRDLDSLRSALEKYRGRPRVNAAMGAATGATTSAQAATAVMEEVEVEEKEAPAASTRYASMSLADACEAVLREEGHPLRTMEIVNRLLKGGARTHSATPYNVIVTAMRRDARFVRLEPGLWGLEAWGNGHAGATPDWPDPTPSGSGHPAEGRRRGASIPAEVRLSQA